MTGIFDHVKKSNIYKFVSYLLVENLNRITCNEITFPTTVRTYILNVKTLDVHINNLFYKYLPLIRSNWGFLKLVRHHKKSYFMKHKLRILLVRCTHNNKRNIFTLITVNPTHQLRRRIFVHRSYIWVQTKVSTTRMVIWIVWVSFITNEGRVEAGHLYITPGTYVKSHKIRPTAPSVYIRIVEPSDSNALTNFSPQPLVDPVVTLGENTWTSWSMNPRTPPP